MEATTVVMVLMALIVCIIAWSVYTIINLQQKVTQKEEAYNKLLSQKKSSEVRLGQISENLAPFLDDFKYNPKRAHFIGQPIDYIVFEDDKIIFLEVKSGGSQLNTVQKSIKDLVKKKQVFWDEMRINGSKAATAPIVTDTTTVSTTPGGTTMINTTISLPVTEEK